MISKNCINKKKHASLLKVSFVILALFSCGVRLVQRTAAQTAIDVSTGQAMAKGQGNDKKRDLVVNAAAKWSVAWKRTFSRYEKVLQRPLTPAERRGIYNAYQTYRINIAKTLGVTTRELVEKERALRKTTAIPKPPASNSVLPRTTATPQ